MIAMLEAGLSCACWAGRRTYIPPNRGHVSEILEAADEAYAAEAISMNKIGLRSGLDPNKIPNKAQPEAGGRYFGICFLASKAGEKCIPVASR